MAPLSHKTSYPVVIAAWWLPFSIVSLLSIYLLQRVDLEHKIQNNLTQFSGLTASCKRVDNSTAVSEALEMIK